MSGPPYPPLPTAGSNAIGSFIIGVSPIGTISSFNWWISCLSQYANSPILTKLLGNMAQYLDQTANFDNFFDYIWNVDTAQGEGLNIWGRIVGVTRTLQLPIAPEFFGFEEAGALTFGQGTFYTGVSVTSTFDLPDPQFRLLIFAKALSNISDGSIPSINQILLNLFPMRGDCYVVDDEDMTMVYKFNFALSTVEVAILNQSGVLPKPTGVSAQVIHL